MDLITYYFRYITLDKFYLQHGLFSARPDLRFSALLHATGMVASLCLELQLGELLLYRPCGEMASRLTTTQRASGDCRFEPCLGHLLFSSIEIILKKFLTFFSANLYYNCLKGLRIPGLGSISTRLKLITGFLCPPDWNPHSVDPSVFTRR